jgi:hypothetical protein
MLDGGRRPDNLPWRTVTRGVGRPVEFSAAQEAVSVDGHGFVPPVRPAPVDRRGAAMAVRVWKLGDRVYHAGRPEWGAGEVRTAENVIEDGRAAQRLTVRFDRAGVKILSTTFADLRPADDMPALDADAPPAILDNGNAAAVTAEKMTALPEAATDPFKSKRARLEYTIGLFRFTGSGASLVDWAAMQSGLSDPLSRFSRHELEQFFERFRQALDAHARKLIAELKREDPSAIGELAQAAPPASQQALKRLIGAR